MRAGVHAAAALVAVVLGVAGCSAAATPATPSSVGTTTPEASPSEASASPTAFATASREPAGDLGREIEVGILDPDWTLATLEFASDGESIIFSSGVALGPTAEFAPDLWRYVPGADGPELLWQNPNRDHSLVRIGGEFGTWAFVDIPAGERAWDLWLLPSAGADAILMDSHPGDLDVPSAVPSFVIHQDQVAWTSFDRGPDGSPVSQLLYARAPDWEPMVVAERDAQVAELWLPSMVDTRIVYCEVVYSADRSTDERHVYLADVARPEVAPQRLDTSGRATMPLLLINDGVVWKEADPGFSMFNWGRLFRYELESGEVAPLGIHPQEYVNYPSGGSRFIAAWGANSAAFGVYDLDLVGPRLIDRWPPETNVSILRPHISWDLLVWLHAEGVSGQSGQATIRYAFMPSPGSDRDR